MREHSRAYTDYINSFQWYLKRRAALGRAGKQCERCQASGALEVHHLRYDRLGYEEPEDLLVLCPPCHAEADRERKDEGDKRRWWARVGAWATKKYGEDWNDWHTHAEVEEEFEDWLESKRDNSRYW